MTGFKRALATLAVVGTSCEGFVVLNPRFALRATRPMVGTTEVGLTDEAFGAKRVSRRQLPVRLSSLADDPENNISPTASVDTLNSVAALNAAAIGIFLLAALYELLHVDIEAAVVLFQMNDSMEASALWTTVDLFLRLPMDSLHAYEALVPTNPLFYKACTSGVAYTVGDFVSQVYQGRTLETIDLKRTARSGTAGFIGHGPLCHYWMLFMESHLDFGGAWWGTGVKVLADQTVWGLYLNAMYSFLIGTLALRPPQEVWRDVKVTAWPALRTSWRFWPFVHAISFSHAVPLDLKLLWVDAMEVVWVTLLSKVANDDKEAALTDDVAPMCILSEDIADPATEVAMMVELEHELSRANAAGTFGVAQAQSLVAQGWTAAWPLVAMWPFLYASYLAEVSLGLESGVTGG